MLAPSGDISAQVLLNNLTVTLKDINPSQSPGDAADADRASGGRVSGLGRSANGTIVYAATEWGGIYKSVDAGVNWSFLASHLPLATFDVEVDPTNGQHVFATSFYDGRVSSNSGISVSSDGGATWAHPATATPPVGFCLDPADRDEPSAFGISIDPANTQNIYIGTSCGLAVSTDGGTTWSYIDPTPSTTATGTATAIWSVIVHHGGIIDLCGSDGHRRSITGGTAWSGPTSTGTALGGGRCSLAVSPDEANVLYAVRGTTISESFDGGGSWSAYAPANPDGVNGGRGPIVRTNRRTATTYDLWFGDIGLYRTSCTTPATATTGTRCGAAWSASFTRSAGGHDDVGDLLFGVGTTNACPVLLASDGGVYRNLTTASPGCQSPGWEQPTTTPHALWVYGMDGLRAAGLTNEDLNFGVQDNGIYATVNGADANPTWVNPNCCDGFATTAATTRSVYNRCCFNVGVFNRLFIRGAALGGSEVEVNTYPSGTVPAWVKPGVLAQFSTNAYVVVTTNGVFITNNIGAAPITWTRLGAASPAGARAVKVAVSAGTPTFFAQTGNADGRSQDGLWSFTGTGTTGAWTQIQTPGNTGGFGIFDVDPTNPNRIIASHLRTGLDPQMVLTINGGTNWSNLSTLDAMMTASNVFRYRTTRGAVDWYSFGRYPQPSLVAFDGERPQWILAGAIDAGLFLSVDGGTTWSLLTDPINPPSSGKPHLPRPLYAYFDHEGSNILSDNSRIFVGTQGRGVWRVDRSMRPNFFNRCKVVPVLCDDVRLAPGVLSMDCRTRPCYFKDLIDKDCTVKFRCPGCETGGLCPAYQNLFLDGFDLKQWDVGLYTGKGDPVDAYVARTREGIVISFRPDKANYVDGRIGDYMLGFALRPDAPLGRYRFGARISVSDKPFSNPDEAPKDK